MSKISIKETILAILCMGAVIGSFILWRSTTQLIAEEAFNSYGQFIISIGSLVAAASLFVIAVIFVRHLWMMYLVVAVSISIPFLFISPNPLVYTVVGISLLLIMFALRRIRKEYSISVGFSVASMCKAGVPLFLTVYGIIISLFHLNDVQKKDAIRAIFPRPAFNVTIRTLGGPLRSFTGSETFTPDETVDQFFQGLIKKQLGNRGIQLNQVSGKELQRLIGQQRNEIARSYGIKLNGGEKLGDVFYTAIIERISDLLGPYRIYVPYASALTFFLAFKTLSIFLYMIIVAVAFLIIRIMIMIGFVLRKKEQIEVERFTLY